MRSRGHLICLASVYAFTGLVEPHLTDSGQPLNSAAVAQTLVTAVLLFFWCKAHARDRGIEPPSAAPILIAMIAPIGIPYYALRCFGLKPGAVLVLKSISFLLALTALYAACYEISARLAA